MNEYTDRVISHPVWQSMKALGPIIDEAVKQEATDVQTLASLERIRAVLTFVGQRLAGADPQLLHVHPLDGMNNAFQNTSSELSAYVSNGSVSHVTNANAQADLALAQLPAIPYPLVTEDWNALRDAGVEYRRSIEEHLTAIQATASEVRSSLDAETQRLNGLSQNVTAEQTKLANIATEYQSQFSTAEASRSAQYDAARDARATQYSEAHDARQAKFNEAQAEYGKSLAAQDADFTTKREAALHDQRAKIAELTERFDHSATDVLARIQQHEKDVEKLVGVIGNLGVTSGYQKTANTAKWATWFWQAVTVLSMGALIGVAYKAFLPVVQGSFTWESFAGRVFLSLTVGVLAAYSGAQADRQGKVERHNRKLALELEAIGPFLAPLPVEKQEAFRLQVGERSFGQKDGTDAKDDKSPATVIDVLAKSKDAQEVLKLLTDLVKATRRDS